MLVRMAALLFATLVLSACGEDPDAPWLKIQGGGFIFNYRTADVFYGCVAVALREFPEGSKLVGTFEDPAGGPDIVIEKKAYPAIWRYSFETPALKGVKKDTPYRAVIRLNGADGKEIASAERMFKSQLDQAANPEVAPTIGPGYTPNPAAQGD